jgi:putative intracellular protease/amidase
MRRKWVFIALGCTAMLIAGVSVMLAPNTGAQPLPAAQAVAPAEQATTIQALAPVTESRPAIALVALNEGTEVADLLVAYGILRRADVADVTLVAPRMERIRLYPPDFHILPQASMASFDARYPDGADYVVVPAMEPHDDPGVTEWIVRQYREGAKVVSICNGSKTIAAAGLLDGRRGTAHWYSLEWLQENHPTMRWVPDRRYVSDGRITTSTGVSANVPVMMALVEAIGGRAAAARVAAELGVDNWDARHRSSAFTLTAEHRKTFIRNALTRWRHETVGIPLDDGVDEVALGLAADAWSRTALSEVVIDGAAGGVTSRHGLTIHPAEAGRDEPDLLFDPMAGGAPGDMMERVLAQIAGRYDASTAAIVALTMEYPWRPAAK